MDLKNLLSKNKEIDVLAYIPDGIFLLNTDGLIDWSNDKCSEIFKIDKTNLLKSDINDLIESGFDLVKQASNNNQSVIGKVKTADDSIYLEITAQPVQTSFVVSMRDVTQNYKTITNLMLEQKATKKNNKDKNNFLVKLSNEFKSPLQSIVGFSQAMIDGLGGRMSVNQEKYVRIINKNSIDALFFMNKIIELAKTESGLFEYDSQIFDILSSIQNIVKDFEQQAKEKKLEWNFDTSEIIKKSVFSDENAIKVLLTNILEICISMTDIGGISLKITNPQRDVVLSQGFEVSDNESDYNPKSYLMFIISDTGEGYSDTELEDLFEPYLQLEKPSKKNLVRSIALASVKNLVNHLQGKIWIESEVMQGTTYSIILPISR